MRMMLHAVIDTEAGNEAIRNGSIAKMVEQMVQQLHPEAVYFPAGSGQRSCIAVFDMADPSQIPAIAEPLFLGGKAKVTLTPCMNLDDLQKGLAQLPPELTSATA
jgi:hypothetical protein